MSSRFRQIKLPHQPCPARSGAQLSSEPQPQIWGSVSIALVDSLLKPIRLRIEFPEHPVVNGQASGSAVRVGGLKFPEQFFRPARHSRALQ
jgi:hypothetical protein